MIPWNLYFTTIRPFKNSPLLTINFSVRGEFIQCWVWELKYISMPEQSWGYMVNQTGSITFVLTFKGNLELCPLQICHFIDKCVTLANELGSTSSQISVKWIIIAKWQDYWNCLRLLIQIRIFQNIAMSSVLEGVFDIYSGSLIYPELRIHTVIFISMLKVNLAISANLNINIKCWLEERQWKC